MNKLKELIDELCPNGVKLKKIWSITAWDKRFNNVEKGKQIKIFPYKYLLANEFNKIEVENGKVKYISTGITKDERYTSEEYAGDYLTEGEIVCIPWGGTPNVKYFKGKFVTGDNRIATSVDTDVLSNKFLYYWMEFNLDKISRFYRGSGIKHPDMKKILDMNIPVPPIEVQREIVRILDCFTELISELTSELILRKKQFNYFRDTLLNFREGANRVKLGDVCILKAGKSIDNSEISEKKTKDFPYPCYGANGIRGFVNQCNNHGENPIVGRQGAHCGSVSFAFGDYYATEHAVVVNDLKRNFNKRFLFHILQYANLNQYKTAGAQPGLSVASLNKVEVIMPTIIIQDKIAKVLDYFEYICSDLNIGLPTEIELRKKQYEYYRDKLLSFEVKCHD